MTPIKKRLIPSFVTSMVSLLTLALFATAQQPRPVTTTVQSQPAPATKVVSPRQTPAPAITSGVPQATTIVRPPNVVTTQPTLASPATSITAPTTIVKPATSQVISPSVTPTISTPAATTMTSVAPTIASPQSEQPTPAQTTRPTTTTQAPAAREQTYVEEKGFKGKVIELKHRDPSAVAQALRNLGSGFKGASISPSHEFKAIVVRDFPENIAAMEEAIKRLDVPQSPRPDIDFRIQVLVASNATSSADDVPAELNDVVRQLKTTFKYNSYNLMLTSTHRTKEGGIGVANNGVVEPKQFNVAIPSGNQIFFNYEMGRIELESASSGGPTVQIGDFRFSLRIPLVVEGSKVIYENVGFRSPLSLRDGERVVVGTTTMGDKGIVVVLSAKSVK